MQGHDIFVFGGSMGAIEVLSAIAAGLNKNLKASFFVVVHIGPDSPQILPKMLSAAGPFPAAPGQDGETIEQGKVYVAPPDYHMMLRGGKIRLYKGPRENLSRPSIDPLFRSAAVEYGPRVVGVLLSGFLNDGSAGIEAVKRCGGIAVIQDPDDAAYPDLPRNALKSITADFVSPAAGIPAILEKLAATPAGPASSVPADIETELRIAESVGLKIRPEEELTIPSHFSCPECGGPVREVKESGVTRFRCYIGHAYTSLALETDQKQALERTFLTGLRLAEERIHLLDRLSSDYAKAAAGRGSVAKRYEEEISHLKKTAADIKSFLAAISAV